MNKNQNQCVPNWDLDDVGPTLHAPPPPPPPHPPLSRSTNSLSAGHDTSMQDYEMAELAWENGQLTMHGLGLPRTDKPSTLTGGTLESIVNQATHHKLKLSPLTPPLEYDDDLVPLFNPKPVAHNRALGAMASAVDALVPTANNRDSVEVSKQVMGCSTRVGSCSVPVGGMPVNSDWSVSASAGSDRWRHGVKRTADDTCENLRSMTNTEMTSASFGASLDNTTRTVTFDDRDHDSVCHSRPEREMAEDEDYQKKGLGKSTSSIKRSRAAAVHNQSERKRRDKINQRMKTLQKLVPNSNKADKASMLDEVIDYMKQLQSQVQMFNTMRLPSMMMPLAIQQQLLQMSMMAPMGMGMGLGMGMNMDQMNQLNVGRSNVSGMPPTVFNPAAFMSLTPTAGVGDRATPQQPSSMVPTDPLATFMAGQSQQSATMDAYTRMAAMYQQLQQQQQQIPNQGTGGSNR